MGSPVDATLLTRHLSWCRLRNLRPSTISQRRYAIGRCERVVGVDLETATSEMLDGWYEGLRLAPESRGTELAHIRQVYKWLQTEGLRADDPTANLARPRTRKRLPRPISDPDLELALFTASTRVLPWLTLAAFAGLRACEIAALRREDLLDHVQPRVLIVVDGKGGKQRVVPLHSKIVVLLPTLPRSGLLFHDLKHGGQLPAHRVSQEANKHLHSLGISSTLHSLRHWFGTRVYQESLDIRLTQDLMGHESPVTTAGYAAWTPGKGSAVVDALHLQP